jgi:hypothetical protein
MQYRHIPTGVIVNSEKELQKAVYEPIVDEEAPKKPTRKRTAKAKEV